MESILTQTQLPHRISLSQAAQLSGYHQDYLGQLCRLGKLRAAKIGRNWYTTQSELRSLLNTPMTPEGILASLEIPQEQSAEDNQDEPEVLELAQPISAPTVAANYVISEVEGLPISLEARPITSKSEHSLQTLITRMRLEELKSEVLQVAGVVSELADELQSQKAILERHEKLLKVRTDLRDSYSPSLNITTISKPVVDTIEHILPEQGLDNSTDSVRFYWLWPALTIALAVVASSLFIANSFSDNSPQFSTVIYHQQPVSNLNPQVAGETDISK